jgi:threonine dehydrogenase-like Zn-dependent dehydrogenase
MKAAVYYGKGDLRVTQIETPTPGRGEVLVKIEYCGVCGTDHHIFHGDGGAAPVPVGTVIGHEFSGTVARVGEGVSSVREGLRVSVDPNEPCGACYYCKNGKAHFCRAMKGYGTTYNGGFAEYVCVPEKQVYPLPDGLAFQPGSQCETLSCCINGIDLCRLRAGASVLVIGAGPIGLMMLQLAKMTGAGKLFVSEPVAEKRALALKLGADRAIDPLNEDIAAILRAECENVDCVIEAAGLRATQAQAVALAGNTATVMLFGLAGPDAEISINTFDVFKRELNITSSFINPYTFSRAVTLLAQKRIALDEIITDIVPLDDIARVFTDESFRRRGKILIRCGA